MRWQGDTMRITTIWTGICRGICRRCPTRGQGDLLDGLLTIRTARKSCGTNNTVYPADDTPPHPTILIVGHVIVLFDGMVAPALWIPLALWLPLTTLLCLAQLSPVKGGGGELCPAAGLARPLANVPSRPGLARQLHN